MRVTWAAAELAAAELAAAEVGVAEPDGRDAPDPRPPDESG
jgi:hypothetical protein